MIDDDGKKKLLITFILFSINW